MRRILGLLMLPLLLIGGAIQPKTEPSDNSGALAHLAPEVRLRKMHLVRPDLIPYPITYDVYC